MIFSLPKEKVESILMICRSLQGPSILRRDLESILGFLNFTADYLPLERLLLKPIQRWVNRHSSPLARMEEISLTEDLKQVLLSWMDKSFLLTPVPIVPPIPQVRLMTDASGSGWGAVCQTPFSGRGLEAADKWPQAWKSFSMNWLELKPILLSLQVFLPQIRGACISLLSDNTTALSCIRKQGSLVSPDLWDLSREIFLFCQAHLITLSPSHLRGILNVLADKASRGVPISTEWALDDPSFLFLCQSWGCPDIDIMATWENSKLSRYISPCPDYQASHMDCFSLSDWNNLGSIYIFPPWMDVVIEKVLQRLVSFRGQGFLIAPRWPSKVWFTALEARCPINIELPLTSYLSQLVLGEEIIFQEAIDLNLHAWKL